MFKNIWFAVFEQTSCFYHESPLWRLHDPHRKPIVDTDLPLPSRKLFLLIHWHQAASKDKHSVIKSRRTWEVTFKKQTKLLRPTNKDVFWSLRLVYMALLHASAKIGKPHTMNADTVLLAEEMYIHQDKQCSYYVTVRCVHVLLLLWKRIKCYIFVCMCAGERVLLCADAQEPRRMDVCACARACNLAYPACNAYAPYCVVICGFSHSSRFFDTMS